MRLALLLLWIGLTAWFLFASPAPSLEGAVRDRVPPPDGSLDVGPERSSLVDPPEVRIGGVDQKCSDCHALFASLEKTPGNVRQHGDVQMAHGMNGRCFNCHDRADRNVLVQRDGSNLGFADSTALCAGCHGTTFRDWERGMHGKTLGSWDAASGEQHRLRCVDCHDPHSPAFAPIAPLPGPNTLRMGAPKTHDHGAEARNPLERWKAVLHGEGFEDHGSNDHPSDADGGEH